MPARPWQDALEEIIKTTKVAAVLFGPTGLEPWKDPEMQACLIQFVKRRLPVIPVLVPGAPEQHNCYCFYKHSHESIYAMALTREISNGKS